MAKDDQEQSGNKDADPRKAVARELWERLGKSRPGPTNADLVYIARFVPLLSTAAVKTLLNHPLTVDELKELIQHVPKAQEIACKRLLELPSSEVKEEDLKFAFAETKSLHVAKVLLKRFPSNANLGLIERTTDELSDLIAKIRAQETTSTIMKEIDRKL
jgi:hypothetical protein